MSKRTSPLRRHEPVSLRKLSSLFEVVPLSSARADLSQLVERIAHTGTPVIISRHDRSRVAVVPLDMLARDHARFVAAATATLKRAKSGRESESDDVSFEDIEGLRERDLSDARAKAAADARAEDQGSVPTMTEAVISELVKSRIFTTGVERILVGRGFQPVSAKVGSTSGLKRALHSRMVARKPTEA
jgi:prevent-host-death family protein